MMLQLHTHIQTYACVCVYASVSCSFCVVYVIFQLFSCLSFPVCEHSFEKTKSNLLSCIVGSVC